MSEPDQDDTLPVFEAAGDGRRFIATERAAGPWSAAFCHGGAPSALLVQVAEGVAAPVPMDVARVTVELLRPVPIAGLDVYCSVVREGRKLQLLAMSMRASATEVARASILRIRTEASAPVELVHGEVMSLPAVGKGEPTRSPQKGGFSGAFDMRSVHGGFERLGPASVWFRMRAPLVAGVETTPAARAVAAADYANGIAGILPFEDWSYPTLDLTVGLTRPPVGDWIMVDACTSTGGMGRAICHARIGDERGWTGHALQTSIIERR